MKTTICACTRLRRSARAVTSLYDSALAETGLTTPQFSLLRTLQRSGALSVSALAQTTGHDRTSISRMVAGLDKRGYVALSPGADQRERIVALTDGGLAAIADARTGWEKAEARVDAVLGQDRTLLFALLDRIEGVTP